MKYIFLILISSFILQVNAQKTNTLAFEKTIIDIGNILEEKGEQTIIFKYTNKGLKPILVLNVRSSCGCTIPEWSKKPIKPNQSGEIKVIVNPKNRPGKLTKSVIVTTNGTPKYITLTVKANVIAKHAQK